jgi:hypothetical protein
MRMARNKINIIIPSYKRAGRVKGYDYFPTAKICIPRSQETEYARYYNRSRLEVIPDEMDGDLARKRNWILNTIKRPLIMIDDDVSRIATKEHGEYRYLTSKEADALIVHGFNLAEQWGCKYWGINVNTDRLCYQEYKPFSLSSVVLDPFAGHLDHDLMYDSRMGTRLDYDMSLQQLNKYRKILRLNKYMYDCAHGDNAGGLAGSRTMETEAAYARAIEAKWGRHIISYSLHPKRMSDILNAMVNIPIKGV